MDVANNWTIVIGIATIISLILYWSKQAYVDPITEREDDIKKKVKEDISTKISEFKEGIGEEQFVDEIYDIMLFRKNLRELKRTFRGLMIPIGLLICIISTILVSIWDFANINIKNFLFWTVIILTIYLIILFGNLRTFENQLSRFSEGENPSDIMTK